MQKKETHRFCSVFPVVPKFPAAHCSRPTGMCMPTVWVQNKAILELRASQYNSRNSHVLLCGIKTQKLNSMCKPAPSVAQQALIWGSPHTARKQCLILEAFPIYFFCKQMKPTMNPSIHSIFEVISETSTHSRIKQNMVERKCFKFIKRVSEEVQSNWGTY